MEHSKDYYQAILDVIDFVNETLTDYISLEKGYELSGDYWPDVIKAFIRADVVRTSSGGSIWLRDLQNLAPLAAECEAKIKAINAAERHFKLSIDQMEKSIEHGEKAYRISIIALILSSLAILVEIWLGLR